MPFDPGLAERVREVLGDRPGISERRMFGGMAFMLHGHMFVGLMESTLMARVGPDRYADALAQPHTREMDFSGKPMKGYIYVDPPGLGDDKNLQAWVDGCAGFVATLPPKAPKAAKAPKAPSPPKAFK